MASTVKTKTDLAFQRCIMPDCAATYDVDEVRTSCDACGGLLDVAYDWDRCPSRVARSFEAKWAAATIRSASAASGGSASCCRSPRRSKIVTIGEGQTLLQQADAVGQLRRPASRASCSCSTRG